nr:hypothetical protein [Calditrichia bacterium]
PGRPGGFVHHIPTMNISYKRWVFDELGGFDPHFYPQEDLKFNFYLRQAGHRILFDPAIRVHHTHRSTYRAFLGHQERIGKINSQVLKLLPLSGAGLARNKGLFMLLGPFLPFVKLTRTFFALLTQYPSILFKHPGSWMAFTIGVFYWFKGFAGGVFSPPLMENKGE